MLVLTRKRTETIRIGEDILIKVIRTGKGSVKIGVEAPADVRVLRGELTERPPAYEKGDVIELKQPSAHEIEANCSDQFPHPHIA